jgi:hypothetical protein
MGGTIHEDQLAPRKATEPGLEGEMTRIRNNVVMHDQQPTMQTAEITHERFVIQGAETALIGGPERGIVEQELERARETVLATAKLLDDLLGEHLASHLHFVESDTRRQLTRRPEQPRQPIHIGVTGGVSPIPNEILEVCRLSGNIHSRRRRRHGDEGTHGPPPQDPVMCRRTNPQEPVLIDK